MTCRIAELRNKQVVCVKNGCVLGYISDVEINTADGRLEAIVIFGRLRFFGLLGREDDIIIPWHEIEVIGRETVLVNTDPAPYVRMNKAR
ncbi:MAG: YlmC/YmxH family sporulation protein [Clostridia bacterium]|nr:YlmC/YmxH family sporulation protein [Clostridia bacterium]MEE1055512.1 YlmC/YmxH family sporulation protein [Acutalibacteraceae bacterium]